MPDKHSQALYQPLESKLVAYCVRTRVDLGSLLCNFGFSGEGYTSENEAELEEADRRPKMERFKYTTAAQMGKKWESCFF